MTLAANAVLAQSPAPADIVFVHGKVFTADDRDHVIQAFAIKGERFAAVGSDSEMQRCRFTSQFLKLREAASGSS